MIIKEEFKRLIPALSEEEYQLLEESIIAEGCREALLVWHNSVSDNAILVDGHNRKEICDRHGIEYKTKQIEFKDENQAAVWIIKNQLGRRNISAFVRAELALKMEPLLAEMARKRMMSGIKQNPSLNSGQGKVSKEIAKSANVGHDTIHKVKKIISQGTLEQIQEARTGKRSIHGIYKKIRSKEKREEQAQEYRDNPLPEGEFDVIYADPPWHYDFAETKSREIENQYPTMELEEICDLELPIAENAILFLWAPVSMAEKVFTVINRWNFRYRSSFVWDKEVIGMGYWARIQHELLYVCTKGDMPTPAPENRYSSVIRERRGKHSKKPTVAYEMIEQMYPDRKYLELFAREQHNSKWTVWGNENV